MGWQQQLGNALNSIGGLFTSDAGLGIGALASLYTAYDRLGDVANLGETRANQLATDQLNQTQFQPYSITTAQGGRFGMTRDPETGQMSYNMALGDDQQAFQNALFGDAQALFGRAAADPTERENQLYEQIRAATAPQEMRDRLGLEERLSAQGRLGVQTNQFGGTPEQLAMEKAQMEAMANARLGAASQARSEQMQQGQLAQGLLGASYVPQAQMLAALSPGQTAAAAQQQAQLYGAGLFGEATASGIDVLLGTALGQSNLFGQAGAGLLAALANR